MTKNVPICVAHGDGIGPEIMAATLHILKEGGASLDIKTIEVGEQVYLTGVPNGIDPGAWEAIRSTKCLLKAPLTTPQGGGYKSVNVTIRTALNLYANIRPCVAYAPYVHTKHPGMDVVVVRENEEDLYTGIEYRQTHNVHQALKLISRQGSEKIIRYAFEYARRYQRKKVTCFTKDNVLKISDGLFHHIFDRVAKDYPDIDNEHWIVDIGAAKLANTPEAFDIVVLLNLYGDILSDVAAQIAGSVGLAGSANIGDNGAMFEAIHGSAPRRAGQNLANPSGLLMGAVLMLLHIGQADVATRVHNAWLRTLEEGVHTYDIFKEGVSTKKVGTKEFAQAVVERLGKKPEKLPPVSYTSGSGVPTSFNLTCEANTEKKELVGIDVFVEFSGTAEELQAQLPKTESLTCGLITNRGAKMWPEGMKESFCVDHWRCRYLSKTPLNHQQIAALINAFAQGSLDFIKTEHLYSFDGQNGFA